MEYSGISLPGIVSPDENIENFAKLYGNDRLGMMLMASTIGDPYNPPSKPPPKENLNFEHFSNLNRPARVDQRNLKTGPQNGVQPFHGPRAIRQEGYGNHYNSLPTMEHHYPKQSHHKKGFELPRAFQGPRPTRQDGYGDHYHRPVNPQQQERKFPIAEHQNQYSFPNPPRYAWL